jgi:hypothetical protein
MPQKEAVFTDKAPPPLPFFSQAIKCQGMVYCSGSIGGEFFGFFFEGFLRGGGVYLG